MVVVVPISEFASCMGYCQFRIINSFHLGLSPKVSAAQINGKKVHEELEDIDVLIPREAVTREDLLDPSVDLDIPRETLRVLIKRKNKNDFVYIGRMDKVMRLNGNIHIIDDKTTSKPRTIFPDKPIQLSCYCEGFKENYSDFIAFNKIFFSVIQRDKNGSILQEDKEEFTKQTREMLMKKFDLFERILNKEIEPEHHNNINKCRACGFDCKFKI